MLGDCALNAAKFPGVTQAVVFGKTPSKYETSYLTTDGGAPSKVIYLTPLPEKAVLPIEVRLLGNVIVFKFEVFANANHPILSRLEFGANVREVSPVLSQNAPYLICVTVEGMVTLVTPLN
jgi:hypothetical protein